MEEAGVLPIALPVRAMPVETPFSKRFVSDVLNSPVTWYSHTFGREPTVFGWTLAVAPVTLPVMVSPEATTMAEPNEIQYVEEVANTPFVEMLVTLLLKRKLNNPDGLEVFVEPLAWM